MTTTASVRSWAFADLDPRAAYELWRLRQGVFVVEQECPYADLDGRDLEPETRHLTLEVGGVLAGYLRLIEDLSSGSVRIGRVLLAREFRGRGLADHLMVAALKEIGDRTSVLDAQSPLAGWYEGFGYVVTGPEFLDDGIPHLPMRRG